MFVCFFLSLYFRPNIHHVIFICFVCFPHFCSRYLYCDEIYLEADNVLATLYAAKKYIVPHLARACVNYLETSLTAKNACLLLSQSRLFEEPELMQRCWEVIDAQVCDRLDNLNVSQSCTKNNDANAVSTRVGLSPITRTNDTNRNHSYSNHIYINNTSIYNNNELEEYSTSS